MGYYKVKNITNTLGKRHPQRDTNVNISINEGLIAKNFELASGQEVAMECVKIPVDLQKLRVKGLVTISEMSRNKFVSLYNESQKPSTPEKKEQVKAIKPVSSKKAITRKSSKKKTTTTTTLKEEISESTED